MQANITLKVPTPHGFLWLVVDPAGERWTPVASLAERIGVPVSLLLAKMDRGRNHWRAMDLVNSSPSRHCLPSDKVSELLNCIKKYKVPFARFEAFTWLQHHAYTALNDYRIAAKPALGTAPPPRAGDLIPLMGAPVRVFQADEAPVLGLQTFNFGMLTVRVVMLEDEPWWMAADVCSVLKIQNPTDALKRLDEDEKGTLVSTEGGPGRRIVNEPGLYALILGSRKPEAKAFKRWITHEVMPSIRKTGAYGVVQQFRVPTSLREALLLAADQQATNAPVQPAFFCEAV